MDYIGDLITEIRKFGLETIFRRYYSVYRGIVTDIDDPQNRCRIKVQVPDLFGEEDLASWAEPMVHAGEGEEGKFCGAFNPPKIDDWVFIEFEKGQSSFPLYRPIGWMGDDERVSEFDDAGEWNMMNPIFISRFGHKIYVDETDGKAKIFIGTNKGQTFTLSEEDGKELIKIEDKEGNKFEFDTAKKDCNLDIKNNWTINVAKDANIKVGGDINAECTNLNVKASKDISAECVKVTVKASGDASLECSKASIKASGDATLECAKATITASGAAEINAPSVKVNSSGSVEIKGSASVKIQSSGSAEFSGTASTKLGSGGGATTIEGAVVLLAGGGSPIAKVGSTAFGTGNLGGPVISTIISGSGKVLSA